MARFCSTRQVKSFVSISLLLDFSRSININPVKLTIWLAASEHSLPF
jgi:hypothetical protein